MQMELIELLCTDVEIEAGKLFAVGDQKQSIYRFRGERSRLSRTARSHPRTRPHATFPQLPLATADPQFRRQRPARAPDYEPLEPNRPDAEGEPKVEVLWTPRPTRTKIRLTPFGNEKPVIARRIRQMVDDGRRRVWDADANTLRAVRLEDVVLLFRSMSSVPIYEEALRRRGLDYYLIGGRAFFAQQEIYDLYTLVARGLENTADSMSLAGARMLAYAA